MGSVLDDHEQEQICALGRLGWPLLRIQRATVVRRETIGAYLRAAGHRDRLERLCRYALPPLLARKRALGAPRCGRRWVRTGCN